MAVLLCQMTLNDGGIYRVGKKLVVSCCSAQNLPDLVNWSVLTVDGTELAIIAQSDRSNKLKFEHWDIWSTAFGQPNLAEPNL